MSKSNSKSTNSKSNKTNIQKPMIQNPMMQMQNPMMIQNPYNPTMMQMQNPYNPYNPMMQMQNPMMLQNSMMQPMMQMQNPMIQPMMHPMMMQMQNPMMQPMMQPMMMQMQNPIMQPMIQPMMMQMQNPPIQKMKSKNSIKEIVIEESVTDDASEEALSELDSEIEITNINLINSGSKKRKIISDDVCFKPLNRKDNISLNEDSLASLESLANLFNNTLDNRNLNKRQKKDKDVSFLPYKDGKNVINYIKPVDSENAHFNNETHLDEKYHIEFLNGRNEILEAKNINISALKTHKITSEHNAKLDIKLKNQNGVPVDANTIIYVRCSKENDTSIETQTQVCSDYALKNNLKLLSYGYLEDNGISARNGNNFKNGELSFWIKYLPDNSNLIIYSPDRWSRHTLKGLQELDHLVVKKNMTIHFVNNDIKYNKDISSAHKAIIQSELMTAEKQSNDTSEKIKGTLIRLKAEGHVIGKAPYGFKNSFVNGIRKRVLNTEEQDTIKNIKAMNLDIHRHFNDYKNDILVKSKINIIKYIIRKCIRNGIKNRNGLAFTISQIRTIIKEKQE